MFLQVICAPEFEIANFAKLKTGEGKEKKEKELKKYLVRLFSP